MRNYEDEARGAIESIEYSMRQEFEDLRSRLMSDESFNEKRHNEDHVEERMKQVKSALDKWIPRLKYAAESGDVWRATLAALNVGMLNGFQQYFPLRYHAERKIRLDAPVVQRGRKHLEGDAENRQRRAVPVPDELFAKLRAIQARNPGMSDTSAARNLVRDLPENPRTGKRFSPRHILDETKALRSEKSVN